MFVVIIVLTLPVNQSSYLRYDCFILELIDRLVEWDIVMEGLVSFAFSLMEVSANKSCFGKPASSSGSFQSPTPAHHLNLLGTTILEEGSKVHSNVAVEIVNQLINRIITKSRDQVPCHFSGWY